ncbi:outer membrane beta-barrel protein [Siphonobacter sp. SORGH_AS_1065]|uniref:outer membrane beta-barrel protein n=1 Tax=Siphonobacter sp. SORGH_AS_1065 TaxID=3041795 RepID=UPI002786A163|nr:outer membrane beta-barrel protein [Siphonobacter sp. SORGH_AS_1065]MDQ1090500.1 hypothetical protein [Siphonobacter sp. SORGH_AS_1065]
MKKKYSTKEYMLFIVLILNVNVSQAQSLLNGKIIYDKNKIEHCNVYLYKTNQIVSKAITDTTGSFIINVTNGIYDLIISCENLTKKINNININGDTTVYVKMEEILISTNLNEVNITASKRTIERKVDRLIFNVGNNISLIGGDALDALSKTPGVKVTSNNSISLIGKSSVRIFINDRIVRLSGEDLVNYLKSIPADELQKIEVITNPPSKYDAEGNSGILNIVTKKNRLKGFYNNIRMGSIFRYYNSKNAGINSSYSNNKIVANININVSDNRNLLIKEKNIYYVNNFWQDKTNTSIKDQNIGGSLGLDYAMNKKILLGLQYTFSNSNNRKISNSNTEIISYKNILDSIINTVSSTPNKSFSQSLNIHNEFKIDSLKSKFITDFDYFSFNNKQEQIFISNSIIKGQLINNLYPESHQITPQNIDIYSIQTEFISKFKDIDVSMGAKISNINNNSSSIYQTINDGIYKFDSTRSYEFKYKEFTQAVFMDAKKEFKYFDIKIGIRAENTQTEGFSSTLNQKSTNKYFKIFPTVYFVFKNFKDQFLSISYSKRINRPQYSRLNPFRLYINPFLYSEGNPLLQPSFSNNIEIQHSLNDWLQSQFFISYVNNGFDQIGIPDTRTNVVGILQKNIFSSVSFGVAESVNKMLFNKIEINSQFILFHNKTLSSNKDLFNTISGWSAYISSSNNYSINKSKTLLCNIDFWYQLPQVDGIDKVKSYYSIDAGIKSLIYNKKIVIGLSFTDIIKSNKVYFTSTVNNIRQDYGGYAGTRSARITFSYKFGSSKSIRLKNTTSNQSEKSRIN